MEIFDLLATNSLTATNNCAQCGCSNSSPQCGCVVNDVAKCGCGSSR